MKKSSFFWERPLYLWSINEKQDYNKFKHMFDSNFTEDNDHQYCTDNDAFGNILMLVGCPLIPQHHPSLIDQEPYYLIKYFFMSLFVTNTSRWSGYFEIFWRWLFGSCVNCLLLRNTFSNLRNTVGNLAGVNLTVGGRGSSPAPNFACYCSH